MYPINVLEDKGKEEQFLLSELTEYIEGGFSRRRKGGLDII